MLHERQLVQVRGTEFNPPPTLLRTEAFECLPDGQQPLRRLRMPAARIVLMRKLNADS
jgi:hypothetical protein